ncbi:MAG: hypothetical protein R3F48_13450 [Candidatus Zixiibacteriota bacterium]
MDGSNLIPESFYDIIGIMLPGTAFVAAVTLLDFSIVTLTFPSSGYELFRFLLFGYLAGHLLYSSSTMLISRLATAISGDPRSAMVLEESNPNFTQKSFTFGLPFRKYLRSLVKIKWNLNDDFDEDSVRLSYELCRNYVHIMNKDRASFIRKEQAYGELTRSVTLGSIMFFILIWLSDNSIDQRICYAILTAFIGSTFFWRYLQARDINAIFVYMNFIVLYGQEVSTPNGKNFNKLTPSNLNKNGENNNEEESNTNKE